MHSDHLLNMSSKIYLLKCLASKNIIGINVNIIDGPSKIDLNESYFGKIGTGLLEGFCKDYNKEVFLNRYTLA